MCMKKQRLKQSKKRKKKDIRIKMLKVNRQFFFYKFNVFFYNSKRLSYFINH